jgi:hypothetical protein
MPPRLAVYDMTNALELLSMRFKLAPILAVAAVALAAAADSRSSGPDGSEGTALYEGPAGISMGTDVPTGRTFDVAGWLSDSDGAPIRVLWVRMISPSGPGIADVSIRALPSRADTGGQFLFQGDLSRCPKRPGYGVMPVQRIVEPPHGQSDWMLLVSLVFTRPGHYHLYVLKVDYLEDGLRYWDDVHADISVKAIAPKIDPRIVQPRPC